MGSCLVKKKESLPPLIGTKSSWVRVEFIFFVRFMCILGSGYHRFTNIYLCKFSGEVF